MRILVLGALVVAATLVHGPAAAAEAPARQDVAAFEQLKTLAGVWQGRIEGPEGGPVEIRYEASGSGKSVLEKMFPGTDHEMVTVFYLAYDRLQATHYCAMGNQPAYRLSESASPQQIVMEFAGGTGFDPRTDSHAHGETIVIRDADHIEVEWRFNKGETASGAHRMQLERVKAAP